jgi:nicotinamide-nucleotide amidase
MDHLLPLAEKLGGRLKARQETIAVAESSTGGLVSALLLSVPGASAYYVGGGVIYTPRARAALLDLSREALGAAKSQTEDYAMLLARGVREKCGTHWGVGETGSTGPTGRAGHCALAVSSAALELSLVVETGDDDRVKNMYAFAEAALDLALAATEDA